jgi:hypothetical protein
VVAQSPHEDANPWVGCGVVRPEEERAHLRNPIAGTLFA